jgi:adenylosuccinate lyase
MEGSICPLDYRYGRKEMKAVFSEEGRVLYQMRVESALAKAHASVGTISKEDADEIVRVASLDVVRIERIKEIEKETNHDVMAMIKAMTEQCKGGAGKYVHLGATSNDVVDTAAALQIKDALEIIHNDIDELLYTLAKVAKRERDTLQAGRTHGQYAIPITFGFKIAGYIGEVLRHKERLYDIMPRACAGKMAGAVGTGAALGKDFNKIQILVMQELFLTYEPAATQVVGRDRYTELICLLANIATSLERYGTEIRNLQRTEIGEVSEPFDTERQVGSSTMAQKKNPITSENITGLARVIRGFVIPTFENQVLWHERDLSNSSAERFTLSHAFVLLDEMLFRMNKVFSGLEVDADRMMKNIGLSQGLIMAEPVMMKRPGRRSLSTAAFRAVISAGTRCTSSMARIPWGYCATKASGSCAAAS